LDLFMSIDSIDTLLAVLRRAQLLSLEQEEDLVHGLVPHYDDPLRLGEYLVEIDWLSAYQLQLLLAGQWDELLIGPYQVLDRLGEGGISEVFKAWDTLRGRIVALKVLRQHLAGKADVIRQFRAELQVITKLSHPNIIKTYDAHQEGAIHYFAMEFVEGMDLERFVARMGPLPIDQACDYVRQIAQGLQHAHQLGLVHRDVKPANLFLLHPPLPAGNGIPVRRPDPIMKIIDWGLARCARDPADQSGGAPMPASLIDVEKGRLLGTADYIAPEQAQDPTLVDIRADIYSLGATLYYLLAGQPPFAGNSLMQKLLQHREAVPPSLKQARPEVPDELDALVQRMLAKKPEDRFPIPLLVVAPLRRFTAAGGASLVRGIGSNNGTAYRPASSPTLESASSANLVRPGAPGTALNLPRPGTRDNLPRPGTHADLKRPGSNGQPPTRK
jgi:serine/threonine-protein kinase